MALPKFLQPFLPSYDISKMDLKNRYDKNLIIEAILNKGTMKDIKWLFKIFTKREVKNVLRKPSRGCWDAKALNFWTKLFEIKIKPIIYEMAIFNLNPDLEKQTRWFKYIQKNASKETRKKWRELGLLR